MLLIYFRAAFACRVVAIARLKELLAERIADYRYVDVLSGQALQDEIYLQTWIRRWGEGMH